MRGIFKSALVGIFAAFVITAPVVAQTPDLVPAKRLVLSENTDLTGGDIASIFDTTLEACERACLSNARCESFTFNSKNGSCFPKNGAGDPAVYEGAYSGYVIPAEAGTEDRAKIRRVELAFLADWEFASVTQQADGLANAHITNGYSAADHFAAAQNAEANGDIVTASRFVGAALNVTDSSADWAEYARLLLLAGSTPSDAQRNYLDQSYLASVNAYLRADNKAEQHTILVTMGDALERIDRGRDTVAALRLAQSLQPRDDTLAALNDAMGKYGFRIVDNVVESDSARFSMAIENVPSENPRTGRITALSVIAYLRKQRASLRVGT